MLRWAPFRSEDHGSCCGSGGRFAQLRVQERAFPPMGDADVAGEIREVGQDLGTKQPEAADVLVEVFVRHEEKECGTILSVTEETSIVLRASDGAAQPGTVGDLRVGEFARAWVVRTILESCPSQAGASTIEIFLR